MREPTFDEINRAAVKAHVDAAKSQSANDADKKPAPKPRKKPETE